MNAIQQFQDAIRSAGLTPPDVIEADGRLRRFASNGKRGDDAGWYLLHGDDIPAGIFGDWRTGFTETWRADIGRTLTPAEEDAHRVKVDTMRRERETEQAKRKAEAQVRATAIWQAASIAPDDHAYLTRKAIKANGAKLHDGALVIPMRADGELHSLQFIRADGDKRFLTGGRVAGCYSSIGNTKGAEALCIAEGFATGASIHEATGYPVAVAFNAGNLLAVAKAMREKFPDLPLIMCADDDNRTEGNPGLTKAKEAARGVGGKLAIPDFGTDRPDGATDFNDLAGLLGAEAVKRAIANAPAADILALPKIGPVESTESHDQGAGEAKPYPLHGASRYASEVSIIRGCDLTPEAVKWLWPGWLAAGKLHILGGAPGTGKTTLALAMAATITTGGSWPDGTRAALGNVVVWSGEDDPTDTLLPRLILSGADVNRIYFVGDVLDAEGKRAFDPAKDMRPLSDALDGIGDVRLLIVDPIVSAVAGDSHKNAEVRRALAPLVDLAGRMGCALVGVTHFSKGTAGRDPTERITGSLAFGALARLVMVAAKHQDQGDDGEARRVLLRAKSNLGADDGGFCYELRQGELPGHPGIFASSAVFGAAIEGAARDILAEADATDSDSDGDSVSDAKRFLLDLLADGPQPTKVIKVDADGAGYSWATIRRAQKALGIDSTREGGIGKAGSWRWSLARTGAVDHPVAPKVLKNCLDAQQNNVSTLGKSEHLRTENVANIHSDVEVF